MAYGGYYPVSYTPMVQSIPNTQPVAPQPTNAQNALTWVQGEAGAKSYMVAPNNTVLLMDSESGMSRAEKPKRKHLHQTGGVLYHP